MTKFELLFFYNTSNNMVRYITDSEPDSLYEDSYKNMMEMNEYLKINMVLFCDEQDPENHQSLKKLRNTFKEWNKQIQQVLFFKNNKPYRINITNYRSIQHAVYELIKNFSSIQDLKSAINPMDRDELIITERLYNAGIMSCDESVKGEINQYYGYDFKSEYPNCMVNMVLPRNPGKKYTLDSIDYTNLKFGIYRVRITSNNTNFAKVFSFCRLHHYTSRQLRDIYKHRDTFDINFELLPSDDTYDYNAYIYEDHDFLSLRDIFGPWLQNLSTIKEQCSKDNQLIKTLITSAWGNLSQLNRIKLTNYATELQDYDEDEYYFKGYNNNGQFEVIPYNNISKYGGWARLKPFLTACVRQFIMNYSIKNDIVDDIVRCHTDGIMLRNPKEFCKKINKGVVPIPEAKTTGLLKIYNSQRYFHVCNVCYSEYKYKKRTCNCQTEE